MEFRKYWTLMEYQEKRSWELKLAEVLEDNKYDEQAMDRYLSESDLKDFEIKELRASTLIRVKKELNDTFTTELKMFTVAEVKEKYSNKFTDSSLEYFMLSTLERLVKKFENGVINRMSADLKPDDIFSKWTYTYPDRDNQIDLYNKNVASHNKKKAKVNWIIIGIGVAALFFALLMFATLAIPAEYLDGGMSSREEASAGVNGVKFLIVALVLIVIGGSRLSNKLEEYTDLD